MLKFNRSFSSAAASLARTKFTIPKPPPPKRYNVRLPTQKTHHSNNLMITPPIPPTVSNIECPENHPLWQFFSDKTFLRSEEDLDLTSRAWTIPELRRKSFNDLHSLWYTCLKERNVLSREIHLLEVSMRADSGPYSDIADTIRKCMWRIRHVLSERDWAYNLAKSDFSEQKKDFLQNFSKEFTDNTIYPVEAMESWEVLKRFQFAIFGITEVIEENIIDRDFVDGLKFVSNLKVQKFKDQLELNDQFGVITDAGEAFVIFTAENNLESMKEAAGVVKELRDSNKTISRYDELSTISNYVDQLINATPE